MSACTGGFAMAELKYQKQSAHKAARKEEVIMAKETPEESFSRQLESTIKKVLKPEFDQINSRFGQVDSRFDQVDSRLEKMDTRLTQIISKLG
jgi:hypothetical protein